MPLVGMLFEPRTLKDLSVKTNHKPTNFHKARRSDCASENVLATKEVKVISFQFRKPDLKAF
jgi:hypothetical protein